MPRTSRLFELLELLQGAGSCSVPDLARRLGVDERTVRRDIDALRDLGVPVEATRGRYGGYRIGAGYRMPPLMLDDREAVVVLLALVQASLRDPAEAAALATATAKIRRSLPRHLSERTDALLQTVVFAPDGPSADHALLEPTVLLTVAEAVRDRRPLAVEYRNGRGDRSQRSLQPHDLIAYAGRWYLTGLDAPTQAVRVFRLDRIEAARALGGTFPEPAPRDPAADLVRRFVTAGYRYRVVLRIRASAEEIREHLPAAVARLSPLDRSWQLATLHVDSLTWLPPILLAMAHEVIIDEPADLRAAVLDAATRLRSIGEAGPPIPSPEPPDPTTEDAR